MLIQQLKLNYKTVRLIKPNKKKHFSFLPVQSQLKLVEQLHEQARTELNKQIHERTQENTQATAHIVELTTKNVKKNFLI